MRRQCLCSKLNVRINLKTVSIKTMKVLNMSDLLKRMLSELDSEIAVSHVKWLTENTPSRISGKGQDTVAAEYIRDRFSDYGLEGNLLEFEAYNSHGGSSHLIVLSPETTVIDSLPCCHIASTLPQGIDLPLVYLGSGGEADYEGKDLRGKAILVEVSYSPATPEKAMIASKHGVAAMICMNWGTDQPFICNRALKAVWGNPTPETFRQIPQVAGISVSRKSGEYLRDLCAKGEVKINLRADATREWMMLSQPFGKLTGTEQPEKFLLVSAHLDAWEPGVTCNATGIATLLELARVFGKYQSELKRSIYFVNWNGHEIAEAAGSTWFHDYFFEEINKNCIGYINIDSTGMKDCVVYENEASRELSDYARQTTQEVLGEDSLMYFLEKTGDQSFFGTGVPSIAGRVGLPHEVIVEQNGACLGWWNHTVEDNLDKMDVSVLERDNKVDVGILLGLVNAKVLPYDFSKTAEYLLEKLEYIREQSGNIIDLNNVIDEANIFSSYVKELNNLRFLGNDDKLTKDQLSLLNDSLMRVSRALTASMFTYTDKYSQDSYGLSILSKPIPLLFGLIKLSKTDRSNLEFKLNYTELLRNRNRVADNLHAVNYELELLFKVIGEEK